MTLMAPLYPKSGTVPQQSDGQNGWADGNLVQDSRTCIIVRRTGHETESAFQWPENLGQPLQHMPSDDKSRCSQRRIALASCEIGRNFTEYNFFRVLDRLLLATFNEIIERVFRYHDFCHLNVILQLDSVADLQYLRLMCQLIP